MAEGGCYPLLSNDFKNILLVSFKYHPCCYLFSLSLDGLVMDNSLLVIQIVAPVAGSMRTEPLLILRAILISFRSNETGLEYAP